MDYYQQMNQSPEERDHAIKNLTRIAAYRDAKTGLTIIFFLVLISLGLTWWFHGVPPIKVPKPYTWFFAILIVGPAAIFSWPAFYRSFIKNKNWLNILGLIIVTPFVIVSVASIAIFAYSEFQYLHETNTQDNQAVNSTYAQFAPRLENYYQTSKKYPGNFCDLGIKNITCQSPPKYVCISELEISNCTRNAASGGDTDHQQVTNNGGSPNTFTYSTMNLAKGFKLCYNSTCINELDNKKQQN